jgi:hypothetical protein
MLTKGAFFESARASMFLPMTPPERDTLIVALLAAGVAIASLGANLNNIILNSLAERHYKEIVKKNKIENSREQLVLRALVSMKAKHPRFSLVELSAISPMFNEQDLLKRLYDPSQP